MFQKRLLLSCLLIFLPIHFSKGEELNFNFTQSKVDALSKMEFKTKRLLLMPQTPKDYSELAELWLDYDVTKYMNIVDTKYETKEEALESLRQYGNKNVWVVMLQDNTCIGNFCFRVFPYSSFYGYSAYNISDFTDYKAVDIGYFIGKKFWKQGFAREVGCFLALKIFQCVDLKVLSITIHEKNINSIRLAKTILDFVEKNCGKKVSKKERKFYIEDKDQKKYPTICFWIEKISFLQKG